jgi:hypothetical protein
MLKHKHFREIASAMNWVRRCNSDRPDYDAIVGILDQVEMCLADVLNRHGRGFNAKAFYSDCENGI